MRLDEPSMNIWELLEIEPTTDKKVIRRAYAARSRVIHPEEKPEEFKLLHMAYEAALQYAASPAGREIIFGSSAEGGTEDELVTEGDPGTPSEESPQEQEEIEHSELFSYFTESREKQKQRIETFVKYWQELKNPNGDKEEAARWREYLKSEDFLSIRWNQQIVNLIAEEIDDKFFYGTNEVKIWFWEAYGFSPDDKDKYEGERQKLRQCLYPAYEYYEKVFLAKEWDRKSRRSFVFFLAGVFVCALIIGAIALVYNKNKNKNEQQLIEAYMAERYPGTEFSVPERSRQEETRGVAYNFYASDHPDLMITAKVEYPYREGGRICTVAGEDYGLQLLEYYAAQYGLQCGRMEYVDDSDDSKEQSTYSVLFYSNIEQSDVFCETVAKMFAEQKELQAVRSVGICADNVLFPEVLLRGGVDDFPFDDPQIYDLRTVEERNLAAQIKDAYIIYMFQYESWNLTLEQCREWGSVYEEACRQWQDYRGFWVDMTDLRTDDVLCTIYVSTYMHTDYRHSIPSYEESITVGNAYNLLMIQGTEVTVNEDGSGFGAEINGQGETFGAEPSVRLSKLRLMPVAASENLHVLE